MSRNVAITTVALALAAGSLAPRAWSEPSAAVPTLTPLSLSRVTTGGENLKPFIAARPGGGAYLAWARRDGDRTTAFLARSTDGRDFGAPVRLSLPEMDLDLGAESGPHVAVDGKGGVYVVWAAGTRPASPASGGSHAGHGGGRVRLSGMAVYLARSQDDGRTFSVPVRVSDGPEGPERRFPTAAVDGDGTVYVAWLDKRHETPERLGFSRVYLARSTDGGRTFTPNVDATRGQPNSICHCCKLAMAVVPGRGVFVAYRNEVDDQRDIFLARSQGKDDWAAPAPIEDTNWVLPACPMNGPSLAVDGTGSLHAVWSTGGSVLQKPLLAGTTASRMKLLYRRFDARKGTWEAPVLLGNGGHPRVVSGATGEPYVVWKSDQVMLARLSAEGAPRVATLSRLAEAGAYPSLAITAGGELLAAWQQTDGEALQIHVARFSLKDGGELARRAATVAP